MEKKKSLYAEIRESCAKAAVLCQKAKFPREPQDHHNHCLHCLLPPSHELRHRHQPQTPMFILRCAVMLISAAWLRSRRSRFVFFFLCSPLLLPLFCASFPLLCAAEIFFRLRLRRRRIRKSYASAAAPADDEEDDARLLRCEEGCGCGEVGAAEKKYIEACLLQRYLEDQLLLVRSVYDCGEYNSDDEDDEDDDEDGLGDRRDLNLDRTRVPLLS